LEGELAELMLAIAVVQCQPDGVGGGCRQSPRCLYSIMLSCGTSSDTLLIACSQLITLEDGGGSCQQQQQQEDTLVPVLLSVVLTVFT
jgi:hypothetical protein